MKLFIFARLHAIAGAEADVESTARAVINATRHESGCLAIHLYQSKRDPRLFYIHSHWRDEAAFEAHAQLPHTRAFIERVNPLIDPPLEVVRTTLLD
jgi:quinol monooxygenase YgiN